MGDLAGVLAVSEFWGGDGKTWLAALIVVVLIVLSGLALYNARTFVKKI
ncbi:MAG: hypothetical protein M3O34_01880 [Chloroflexota bacterium]|nr:hypothetical protein [Chloroflexota bacterium]